MNFNTGTPWRVLVSIVAILAAVASIAITITQGTNSGTPLVVFTPRTVFGMVVPLIIVVVALGHLVGSDTSIREGVTGTHVAIAAVWALYLLAGIGLVLAGYTGWVVLGNLMIAVVAGVLFGYPYIRR